MRVPNGMENKASWQNGFAVDLCAINGNWINPADRPSSVSQVLFALSL